MPYVISLHDLSFVLAAFFMLYLARVDLRSFSIPDLPLLAVLVLGGVYRYTMGSNMLSVVLIALGVGALMFVISKVFETIRMKPVLGYGDVKLFAVAAVWLSISQLPMFFIVTGVAGIILSLFFLKKKYFPLAPAIVIAWGFVLLV